MAIKSLPVDSSLLKYEFTSTIKGIVYNFYMRFNARANKWVMNIYDSEKNPIVLGLFVNKDVILHKYIGKEEIKDLELFTFQVQE